MSAKLCTASGASRASCSAITGAESDRQEHARVRCQAPAAAACSARRDRPCQSAPRPCCCLRNRRGGTATPGSARQGSAPRAAVAQPTSRSRPRWMSATTGSTHPAQLVLDLEAVDRPPASYTASVGLTQKYLVTPGKGQEPEARRSQRSRRAPQPDGYAVVACNAPYSIQSVCMSRQKPQPLIWQNRARSVIAILGGRGWPEGMRQ